MARLLTVVNERKKIRNEYRRHLEQEYIDQKKAEEQEALSEQAAVRAQHEEIKDSSNMHEGLASKVQQFHKSKKSMLKDFKETREAQDSCNAPLLTKEDVVLLSQTREKLS